MNHEWIELKPEYIVRRSLVASMTKTVGPYWRVEIGTTDSITVEGVRQEVIDDLIGAVKPIEISPLEAESLATAKGIIKDGELPGVEDAYPQRDYSAESEVVRQAGEAMKALAEKHFGVQYDPYTCEGR